MVNIVFQNVINLFTYPIELASRSCHNIVQPIHSMKLTGGNQELKVWVGMQRHKIRRAFCEY